MTDKNKGGRPTLFTQDLADKICEQLALGDSLRTVCKPDEMPAIKTIFNWFRTHEEFLQQYARAKQESADAMAEDILDIADDTTRDYIDTEFGYKPNPEIINRSRLRVDTRKWLMSKMKPKKYGDKMDLTSDGEKLDGLVIVRNAEKK